MNSFYWHDYETWGATPSVDRPSQFAGVRTDEALNVISDPLVVYCRPPEDLWPQPEACLVTGITPQEALKKGLSERDFIAKIHHEFIQPNTCGVGYNSLRFDDEVTRYTLYRNYYDPYEREWRNGNSRWDIIDMLRLVYALRPSDIEWPMVDEKPSFKLENLSAANGIAHQSAHDAYSDVEATINLAKLIKTKKPQLFDYVLKNKSKQAVSSMIDISRCKPLLHISSMFPSERGCAGLVAPLAMHPINKNAVIAYDLSVDPGPMAQMSPEEIKARVFVSAADLPEGQSRFPVKLIHLNKCPVLATTKLLDDATAKRLHIDKDQCDLHWQSLRSMNVGKKLQDMYRLQNFDAPSDPEQKLYDGFVGDQDKKLMAELRQLSPAAFAERNFVFNDERLNGMFLRYKARNAYSSMSTPEKQEWREFVKERLENGGEKLLGFEQLLKRISELKTDAPQRELNILQSLEDYAHAHMADFAEIHSV